MKKNILFIFLLFLFSLFLHASPVLADGTYYDLNTTQSDNGGPDAVTWSTENSFMIDTYQHYMQLFEDASGNYYFAYSNSLGASGSWKQTSALSGVVTRPTAQYDSIDDTIQLIDAPTAGSTSVQYRRYSILRNADYTINAIVPDPNFSPLTLDSTSSGSCSSVLFDKPIVIWQNTGTHGTLVAFWSTIKTCSGVHISETRAAMRILSDTSADGVGSNWVALNGTSDTSTGPADIAYNKLYSFTGTASELFQQGAIIPGSGSHANDIYYINIDENDTHGFRRLAWNPSNHNWSGTWTTRATIGGNVDDSHGYPLKSELMSKPVYDSGNDTVYVGIARWISTGGAGDTDSLYGINNTDSVSAATNVYFAGGTHCINPTFDLMYDSNQNKIYFFFDISGTTTCGNVYYKTYDGSTLSSSIPFYTVSNRSVDIPIVYPSRINDQILSVFRLNNATTPTTPPHQIYFGDVQLNTTLSHPSIGITSPYSPTLVSDFNPICAVATNTQVTDINGGEISLLSSFRDDFSSPLSPYTSVFADLWTTGIYSGTTPFTPVPVGAIPVGGSGGAYLLGNGVVNGSTRSPILQKNMKFQAKFYNDAAHNHFQHIGWADNSSFGKFILFSTNTNGHLWARVYDGTTATNVDLGATYIDGQYHTYEIGWNSSSEVFIVDGTTVQTINQTMSTALYPIISNNDGNSTSDLIVSYLSILDYATSGTYQTCALNSGSQNNVWGNFTYNATTDASTSVSVQTRTSNNNVNWTAWSSALTSGTQITSQPGQYLEYLVTSTGTSTDTPTFNSATITFPGMTNGITNPSNGALLPVGVPLTISANVTTTAGISNVKFYINSTLLCTDNSVSVSPSTYNCNWTPGTTGSRFIKAVATDVNGNVGTSVISVTIQ